MQEQILCNGTLAGSGSSIQMTVYIRHKQRIGGLLIVSMFERFRMNNRQPALQTVGVEFERSGHFGGTEGLVKDTVELHYRKRGIQRFWSLNKTRDVRVRISWPLLLRV